MLNQFSFISHLHFHFQIYSSRIYLKSTHPSAGACYKDWSGPVYLLPPEQLSPQVP